MLIVFALLAACVQQPEDTPASDVAHSSATSGQVMAVSDIVVSSSAVSGSVQEPELEPAPELTDSIMGPSIISAETMVALFNKRNVVYPTEVYGQAGAATIEDFCTQCSEEAAAEGVRAEVLFAQAMHETAWLQFGNQVSVEQCNFGGLGAVNSGGAGEIFPDVRTGLRAQVQHLKAYASTENLANELVDTRFELVERGCAPTVHDLGGRWAWPGDGYGEAIMSIVQDLYDMEYNTNKKG